jgi:Tol biopolymer transport system component
MRRPAGVLLSAAVAITAAAALWASAGFGQDVRTERVSVSSTGAEANGPSLIARVSASGRYVAFSSDSSNLVPGGTANRDVFVRDRVAGTTERVSVASDGTPGQGPSFYPSISADGRYVVFQSDAGNLVASDSNSATDIFLRDRTAGVTTLVSVSTAGVQGDKQSVTPSISADGRYVTFTSLADNLVPNDTNNDRDVFVRDLVTGTTELVSQSTAGALGNGPSGGFGAGPARISAGGRYVVFGSFASNLVAGDTNNADDIFLHDRVAGTTERVSVTTSGTEGNNHSTYGSVSDDGRYVAFFSAANNLVTGDANMTSDIFLRDRLMSTTTRISVGPSGVEANGASGFPVISGDGSAVAFESLATNLVSGDTNGASDVFVYHAAGLSIDRVSVPDGGGESNSPSTGASITSAGDLVAFQSDATNLVANDGNGVTDVFTRGKAAGPPPPTPSPTSQHLVGDANHDGQVNSIDAALVLQYSAGLLPSPPGGSDSDVNRDGQTNAIDATLILQYAAGLINHLPP